VIWKAKNPAHDCSAILCRVVRGAQLPFEREVVMDDQILQAQASEEPQAKTVSDLARKLRKREHRLLVRLQEAQQKEARALERLRRAGARLERRRARLERINNYLILIHQQIADLEITDRQPEQVDSMVLAVPVTSEPASMNGSEANAASVQAAPELAPGSDTAPGASATPEVEAETTSDTTPAVATTTEPEAVSTSGSTSTAPELVSTPGTASEISTTTGAESASPADSEQEATRRLELEVVATSEVAASPEQEDALPVSPEPAPASNAEPEATTSLVAEPVSSEPVPAALAELEATTSLVAEPVSSESAPAALAEPEVTTPSVAEPVSSEPVPAALAEPEATTSLVAEPASSEPAPAQAVLLAREAWDEAEAEVLSARNTSHGIASSISFLSQTGGLSNESMAELLRKQSESNKAVTRAQNAARLAYDRFLQVQAEAERTAGQQPGIM